jgi:hypothetical protein
METLPDGLADPASDPVARDGLADSARDGKPHPRSCGFRHPQAKGSKEWTRYSRSVVIDSAELRGLQDPGAFRKGLAFQGLLGYFESRTWRSSLTDSFQRPLALRRERTARPSFVFIRVRNPCVFARRRLFG